MLNLKVEHYLKLILVISLISIGSAYFIEYALGHQPCNLCLIERIPYILSIILISLYFLSKKNEKFLLILLNLVFIFATLISFYHFGIENGFFEESSVCNLNNNSENLTAEELLKELKERTISCKDVTFKVLGFSLATINTIISLILSIIIIKKKLINEKNK